MKTILVPALVLVCSAATHAELRIIGVRVCCDGDSKCRVSIYSDVDKENKSNLSVMDAAKILRDVKGWGSSVKVGIVARDVHRCDYLPSLKAVSENAWSELVLVEGEKPNLIFDNIRRRIEKGAKADSSRGNRS